MITTVENLRCLIKERLSSNDNIEIGPVLGSPEKGFNVRVIKYFWSTSSSKNSRMWNALRSALQKNGMEFGGFWRVNYTPDNDEQISTIIDLKSRDLQSAKLERQKLIGDIEATGLKVDVADELSIQKSFTHPYR